MEASNIVEGKTIKIKHLLDIFRIRASLFNASDSFEATCTLHQNMLYCAFDFRNVELVH